MSVAARLSKDGFIIEALIPGQPSNGGPHGKVALGWYPVSERTDTFKAQRSYSDYRRAYPDIPFRVLELPERRIVVLFDPRGDAPCQ